MAATELQTYEPNSGTATTLTVYRRASGSVRKTLVDPVEHVAQSIAETAFAKTDESRSFALTAQAAEVNGRNASELGGPSFRDYAAMLDDRLNVSCTTRTPKE